MMRFIVIVLLIALSGCSFKNVEFVKFNGIKMKGTEGRNYEFDLGAQLNNPNSFGLKLKKANLEVYAQDQFLGTLHLQKKVKLKRKAINDISFPMMFNLEEGGLWSVLRLMKQEEVELRLKGQVKGGVFIFSKKVDVDERKTVPTKGFKLNP